MIFFKILLNYSKNHENRSKRKNIRKITLYAYFSLLKCHLKGSKKNSKKRLYMGENLTFSLNFVHFASNGQSTPQKLKFLRNEKKKKIHKQKGLL